MAPRMINRKRRATAVKIPARRAVLDLGLEAAAEVSEGDAEEVEDVGGGVDDLGSYEYSLTQ
jgi:hypothetical protein